MPEAKRTMKGFKYSMSLMGKVDSYEAFKCESP